MKKKKTIELISVVVIAMALTIVFSGVALASQPVPTTKETEILKITTGITCAGTVVESQGLSLAIDSIDLLDNPPLANGEIYGKIGYDEKMIGSSGNTNFCKIFKVDTGAAPNLDVSKTIGYTQGELGSLSHHEQVGMKAIAAGKDATPGHRKNVLCPFDDAGDWVPGKPAVPGSCEDVHAYSKMVVTNLAPTTGTVTTVGITGPNVNLNYRINADGTGLVVAGVDVYVEDGIGGANSALGSGMAYKEKSIAYGEFGFTKTIGYKSKPPT